MSKKAVTAAIAVLAVVCVFAFLVLGGVIKLPSEEPSTDPEKNGYDVNAYSAAVKYQSDVLANNYLPTFIDNYYYTCDTSGNVKFYTINAETYTFTECAANGSYDVSVNMSDQTVKAKVSYIKTDDGDVAGYGLYTTAISGDTDSLYRYVFFALTNMPSGMGKASNLLLLADPHENNFRNAEKLYSEEYSFNPSTNSAERIYSEANRYVGTEGIKRADYSVLTDYIIKNEGDRSLFISGRHYAEDEDKYDIMRAGGSGNNLDNIVVEKNVVGKFVKVSDGNTLYLTENDDKNVVLKKSGSDDAVKVFECTRDDIFVSGDYFFFNNSIYSVNDDSTVTLTGDVLNNFKADMFACSGKTAFLRGYTDKVNPTIILADMQTGVCTAYVNSDFSKIINPSVLSDGSVLLTLVSGGDTQTYKYMVLK